VDRVNWSHHTDLRDCGYLQMIKILLVAAALWTSGQTGARAEETAPESVANGLQFPEGTIFVGDSLYFVDYAQSSVLRLVGGKTEVVWHQPGCGANGLLASAAGLLVACFDSGALVAISMTGETISTIHQDDRGDAFIAPNDFAADRRGGIYFSASGSTGNPGKVFYLGADRVAKEVASGIQFANGIGLSPDGTTLYVAESATGRILAFAIKPDQTLGPERDFIRFGEGDAGRTTVTPDSLRVDMDGNLFVALYNGGGVAVVSPTGALIAQVNVPAAHHTNLAISPDGKSLYVTAIDENPGASYRGRIVRIANPLGP